uniref:C2H2-type domain-containing protein n=1 Tax=Mycena chlorophos TaxID=658473 RepID=A0ABQ0LUD1_MYCCL|nr:predicted protein [Mycena chlorophos]
MSFSRSGGYVEYPASPPREFACELCPLSFDRNHDLKRHVETHSGERKHFCDRGCGKSFTRKDALKRHQTTFPFCPPVRGPPPTQAIASSAVPPPTYGGPQSPVAYPAGYPQATPAGYGQPIPTSAYSPQAGWSSGAPYGPPGSSVAGYPVTGQIPVANYAPSPPPQYPPSSFVPPPLYGGDYPASPPRAFPCDLCPLSFDRHHDLKRHRTTHAGERPFLCDGCQKTFTRKDALKRHQMSKECGNFAK